MRHDEGLQKISPEEFLLYLRWRIGVDLLPFPAWQDLVDRFGDDEVMALDGELISGNSIVERARCGLVPKP